METFAMSDDFAMKIAATILEDRRGANYYQDSEIFADYLMAQFGSTSEDALEAAQDILNDRDGADYYQDVKILASYLKGKLTD
jgi:hypothetical protein